MADALRTVWRASLWNFHAVEERRLFNMDQRACAVIGIWSGRHQRHLPPPACSSPRTSWIPRTPRSYTINAKRGLGLRVVGGTTILSR